MAQFTAASRLAQAVNIGESWFRLVLGRPKEVEANQAVQLVLQLPDGSFVQAAAKVVRVGSGRMILEAAHADPFTLAVLQRSL